MNLSSFFSNPLVKRLYTRLLIVLVILVAILVGAWYGYSEVEKELKVQERPKIQELNSLQSQVRFLQQQVELYERYGEKYQELIKKGLVKEQDRVFWSDSLINLMDEYIIPKLTFSFSAEKPLSNAQFTKIKIPSGKFFYSRLVVTMNLQHEEDLIRVFESISQKISPLYLVESCNTKLLNSEHEVDANFDLVNGNVAVNCSLIIFHIHPKKKS